MQQSYPGLSPFSLILGIISTYWEVNYMMVLTENQLNNLNKAALVIIVHSLQDQMQSLRTQLDTANAQLADNNRQIKLLTEQIRIMNQFGRQSESNIIEPL